MILVRKVKKVFKVIINIVLSFILITLIIIGIFFYILNCRVTYVDEANYDHYSIVFEEIGEPFLFGSATGRITLKDHDHIIQREKMDVANDGARISKNNWMVEWKDAYVLVTIFQDEGLTIEYTIYYDSLKDIQKEVKKNKGTSEEMPLFIVTL